MSNPQPVHQGALQVQYRSLDNLIPYAKNARTHSDAQVAMIAASIVEYGWTNPILVDGANGVVAGHGRLLAARKLGLNVVPVIELAHLTDLQRRALVLTDNKLTELGGWDDELLRLELQSLDLDGFDLDLTGFDADALAELLDPLEPDDSGDTADDMAAEEDEDIPEAEAVAVSRPGDLWLLGRHRLICGDASDSSVVAALMQQDQARLCFTSPPYGNQRDYTGGGVGDWDRLMQGVFAQLPTAPDAQVLVNLGLIHRSNEFVPYWDKWIEWMRTQGWRRFAWYVWDQGPGLPGDWVGRFAPSFEFVFHFNRQSRKPNKIVPCKNAGQETHLRADGTSRALRAKNGKVVPWTHEGRPTQDTRIPDSVIRVMRHKGRLGEGIDHPAVFPVALPTFVIEAYSDEEDIVFEPFGGSGTTMLAAERTARQCRSIEIAPEYVDVAIKRFRQHHPSVTVTLAATGQSFEEVASAREVPV